MLTRSRPAEPAVRRTPGPGAAHAALVHV